MAFPKKRSNAPAEYMGWATLASEPPCPIDEIQDFADEMISRGLKTVILIARVAPPRLR